MWGLFEWFQGNKMKKDGWKPKLVEGTAQLSQKMVENSP